MGATDVPKQIGPYEILGPLGKGGMGAVYKAMQPSLNRIVAIKVLPPDFAKDPDAVTRFHREAQTVAMLSHPNIVQIIDKGEDQGLLYFAMEYVEGTSLDVVLRQRRLSLQEVVQVIKQIGRGLGAAHRAGVVHRDLNPRNILVSPTLSIVKLADFGISRVESVARSLGTLTTREMTLGSLHYLAPEQAVDASAVDHRADIYSLGVVFYEALTGRIPLGKFSLPSELNRELPSEIDPVVLKCLATEPGDRYATVGQLLDDIDKLENLLRFQLLDELKGLKRGTTMLFKKGSTSFQRNRWVLVLFGLLAVALGGDRRLDAAPSGGAEASKSEVTAPSAQPAEIGENPAALRTPPRLPNRRSRHRRRLLAKARRPQRPPLPPPSLRPRSRRPRRRRPPRLRPSCPQRHRSPKPSRSHPSWPSIRQSPIWKSRRGSSTPNCSLRPWPTRRRSSGPIRRARWRSTATS